MYTVARLYAIVKYCARTLHSNVWQCNLTVKGKDREVVPVLNDTPGHEHSTVYRSGLLYLD
jgi:hypothetical protein